MKVTIVSPESTLFSGELDGVIVPGSKGSFEILNNHAPIISTLSKGNIVCRGKEENSFSVDGGFVEAERNEVMICVEPAK